MIEGARPVLEHLFSALTADLNLGDPSHKSQAADRLLPVVAGIGDPVSRRAWLGSLAIRLGLDERILESRLAELAAAAASAPRPRSAARADASRPAEEPPPSRPATRGRSTAGGDAAQPPDWVLETTPWDPRSVEQPDAEDEGLDAAAMGWAPGGRPAGRPDGRPGRTAPEPGPSISNPDDAAAPQHFHHFDAATGVRVP